VCCRSRVQEIPSLHDRVLSFCMKQVPEIYFMLQLCNCSIIIIGHRNSYFILQYSLIILPSFTLTTQRFIIFSCILSLQTKIHLVKELQIRFHISLILSGFENNIITRSLYFADIFSSLAPCYVQVSCCWKELIKSDTIEHKAIGEF